MKTILFVCHGNICRSVAAEYIFKDLLIKQGLDKEFNVFSRATSLEEIGSDIYPPMRKALLKHNIIVKEHHAKRISKEDYELSDYIFYMDNNNLCYLNHLIPDVDNKYKNITMYSDELSFIDDPWYTGKFDEVVYEIVSCCELIIKNIQ